MRFKVLNTNYTNAKASYIIVEAIGETLPFRAVDKKYVDSNYKQTKGLNGLELKASASLVDLMSHLDFEHRVYELLNLGYTFDEAIIKVMSNNLNSK